MTNSEFSSKVPRVCRFVRDDIDGRLLKEDLLLAAQGADAALHQLQRQLLQVGERFTQIFGLVAERCLEAAENANAAALSANTEAEACEAAVVQISRELARPRRRRAAKKS